MKEAKRVCHACGYTLALPGDTWARMETANGKHYPTKHKGCGGTFTLPVSELKERSA